MNYFQKFKSHPLIEFNILSYERQDEVKCDFLEKYDTTQLYVLKA